jgi:hypothetical protein
METRLSSLGRGMQSLKINREPQVRAIWRCDIALSKQGESRMPYGETVAIC